MIIATKNIDIEEVIKNQDNIDEYITDLIPDILKHNDAIKSNTKYYIATLMMKSDYDDNTKRNFCNSILRDNRVLGYIGQFISIAEIENFIDMNEVNRYYKEMQEYD